MTAAANYTILFKHVISTTMHCNILYDAKYYNKTIIPVLDIIYNDKYTYSFVIVLHKFHTFQHYDETIFLYCQTR